MARSLLLIVILLAAGCRAGREASHEPPPALTAEDAKTAILELIYSGNLENLQEFPIARYRALRVKSSPDDPWLVWGKYEINLDERKYQFSETREEPTVTTRTMWLGEFVHHDGKWSARIPRLIHTTIREDEPVRKPRK